MAEVDRKRTGELQRGVFKILMNEPDGLPARQVIAKMHEVVPPTPFEKSEYPKQPGVVRFDKIIRFMTIGCVKAGWIIKQKGIWSITDEGRTAYGKFSSPEAFANEAHRLYHVWRNENPPSKDDNIEEELSQSDTEINIETAEEQAWADIRSHIERMQPYDVQNLLVPGLLRGMGMYVSWMAPPGADGGVDIIAHPDPLGLKEPTLKVSVRRRGAKADVKDLREFVSRLHTGEVGLFFSVSGFTKEAEKETRHDNRKIRLIDLEKFFDLWVEHYKQIPEESRKLLPIRPVWFLADSESD